MKIPIPSQLIGPGSQIVNYLVLRA